MKIRKKFFLFGSLLLGITAGTLLFTSCQKMSFNNPSMLHSNPAIPGQ